MTYHHNNKDPNLNNLHHAMEYRDGVPHLRVNVGSDTITINGDINVDNVTVDNLATDPVPISSNKTQNSSGNRIYVNTNGTVELGSTTLAALETINATVTGSVSVGNFPATQAVTGTFWQTTQPVSIATMPTTPVTGNVNATITDVITVIVDEDAGEIFGLNNHATNANRGWTMDNTMRPMISIRVNPSGTSTADLMKIVEYEIGNNNANQSTIIYEWYEGDLTIAGAAIPAWTTVGTKGQYRVYQDQYSSNQGNTFTIPSGTVMRHSGIIIGKNTSGDGIEKPLTGGATGKTWTLCLKRLDNATKLDVWFAFTFKEIV
jgi:hypothetical protein